MFPSDDQIESARNGETSTDSDLRVVQELARRIEAALPSNSPDPPNNIIDLGSVRRQRQHKDGIGSELNTISCLSSRIGPRYALLLDILGYKTLVDLSKAHPIAISSIPGIGEMRIRIIASAIHANCIEAPLWNQESFTLSEPEQLTFNF